ncbi:MAG TPA: hypothetical protein VNC50_16495, partial [Planctomycetia bacterium]|nr:hypothetical protein [Planctomycetia bacterium]
MKRLGAILLFAAIGCDRPATPTPVPAKSRAEALAKGDTTPRPGESLGLEFTAWPSVTAKPFPVPPARLFYCRGP